MPLLPSPLSTPAQMPLVQKASIARAARLYMTFDTVAEAHAAAAAEASGWPEGQRISVAEEADSGAERLFRAAFGARTVKIGATLVVLPSTLNKVLAFTSGTLPPSNLGGLDDLAVHTPTGGIFTKTASGWAGLAGGTVTPAPVFSVQPTAPGTPRVGVTITGTAGTASDASSYALQWIRGADTVIAGATAAAYLPTSADLGQTLKLRSTATGPTGLTAVATSAATPAVAVAAAAPAYRAGALPVIRGIPQVGEPLAIVAGAALNADTVTATWLRDGAAINTAPTYTPISSDVGKVISVRFTLVGNDQSVDVIVVSPAVIAAGARGGESPLWGTGTEQTFDAFIDGLTPSHAYVFGTAAATPAGSVKGVAIRSGTDLNAHFNAHQDAGGGLQTVRINSEWQKYQDFSAGRHTFKADRLVLGAYLLTPGDFPECVSDAQPDSGLKLNGNGIAVPWNNLPPDAAFRAAMMTAKVGQWLAAKGSGGYAIESINPGVTIALRALGTSPTGDFTNRVVVLLPIHSGICTAYSDANAAYSNKPTLTINSAQPIADIIKNGNTWMVGRVTGGGDERTFQMNHDVRIESVDRANNVIVLNRTVAYSDNVGKRFNFAPGVEASQVWTKDNYRIYEPGSRIAVEWDMEVFPGLDNTIDIPSNGNRFDYRAYQAAYPNSPNGAWNGLWAYSANGSGSAGTLEFDPHEGFVDTTKGFKLMSAGSVGGVQVWTRTGNGYTQTDNRPRLPFAWVGRHKIQMIYEAPPPDAASGTLGWLFFYIDGIKVRVERYNWNNTRDIQFGMNMAFGWLSRSGLGNLQIPYKASNYTHAQLEILSMKVWLRTGPEV